MVKIMINSNCKQYTKSDKNTKQTIISCLERLGQKIDLVNKDITKIYNQDSIIYDRINSELYIYKCHSGRDNMQLRIVYGSERKENIVYVYLIDFVNKKANNKEYLDYCNSKFRNKQILDFDFF